MRMSVYSTLRPALFMLTPEIAHRAAIRALRHGLVPAYDKRKHATLRTTVAGLTFANPVGLAPGFDKNAECFEGAFSAGCGFVEIGTVTPLPQPGNDHPRVFRLVEEEAVINRLGFNNEGAEAAAKRLVKRSGRGIIGGNVGKNKLSFDAISDYVSAMRTLYPRVDYITANISSPNTPGLRALQAGDELHVLITEMQKLRAELMSMGAPSRPIFVKIAPDCDADMLEAIAQVAMETKLDGLIVSNTTITRDNVTHSTFAHETGGLSGKPLFELSTQVLKAMYKLTRGGIPLIGVGGIASAHDAYVKIRAGASLVQLYTALIYQGFGLIGQINDGLAALLERDGFATIADAVGRDA